MDESWIGKPLALTLDGQRVTGRVVGVHPTKVEVAINVREPAKAYHGMTAKTVLPNGQEVLFDFGHASHFAQLVVEVPFERPDDAKASPADERRRFFRLGVNCPVEVIEDVGNGRDFRRASGQTMNLSGGGMLLSLDRGLLPGVYRFRVHLPEEVVELSGRVIRGKIANGLPVEFVNLNEGLRSKLIRFIFTKLRELKEGAQTGGAEASHAGSKRNEESRYWLRREKYYKPGRIRYW